MSEERTYLELSEAGGSAHKFYEVVVRGPEVAVRFGRIGDPGQTQTKTHPNPEAAKADAAKKIAEKRRKGYEPATPGARGKRSVTRRAIASTRSTARQAPVLWRFASGAPAFGISVGPERCWVGNEAGSVFAVDHDGATLAQFRLSDGVKCIIEDLGWLYAGCDDGRVYDLGGKVPRVAYEIAENVDIYWLDIHDALLAVADAEGRVTMVDFEDEFVWSSSGGGTHGWMVRCDAKGIYHGDTKGVTMYGADHGQPVWHADTKGQVLFGWQTETTLYAGTSASKVYALGKDGTLERVFDCDAGVFSCAASPDGAYVFAGDNASSIYCFTREGERLWKLSTGCGSAFSMQYLRHPERGDRLYVVTTDGSLACIDASETAIRAAQAGTVPEPRRIPTPKLAALAAPAPLDTTTEVGSGVVVECFREGGQLRVRVVSPGYRPGWRVQFPKDLREEGARFVVERLVESASGGFYRAGGRIERLLS